MNILWLSWKDEKHPKAGGAEVVSTQIRKRLVSDGHAVRLLTSKPKGLAAFEIDSDGVEIYRSGSRMSVYIKAFRAFRKTKTWPDLIIDEMNTLPFGAGFYSRKIPAVLLAYQLAREVWFYEMIPPFSYIGYFLEPLYLRLISKSYEKVLTESQSSKDDLQRYGFKGNKIDIFRVGMALKPAKSISTKRDPNAVVMLGAVRPMKRTLDGVRAFEKARDSNPALTLRIAGDYSGSYGKKVLSHIHNSPHSGAIELHGRVSPDEKTDLLRSASLILVTSIKEGWGLIVTEANSQGAVAAAYNVDGLRDSIKNNETGITTRGVDGLSRAINELSKNPKELSRLQKNAWEWSKEFTFDNSYGDFKAILRKNGLLD